ncbi:MAG: hypothetical protein R6X34_11780 [Chloroflexota bacterium]
MTKGGLTKHLQSCAQRQAVIAAADSGKGREETIYHLQVADVYSRYFWLHLEMNGSARLQELDRYLRAIWLECCGHMSEFFVGGAWANEVSMSKRVDQALGSGAQLTHIYDFGTSSETRIKAVASRQGKPTTKHPIALMARNEMPEALCLECGEPATCLCMECLYEEGESGFLCDAHAKDHPHEGYGEPTPLYNSPRMGMCGYDGPAEPPY